MPRPSSPIGPPDAEFAREERTSREEILRRLLKAGWQAAGPTDGWDLEMHGSRLLLAREIFEKGEGRLLIRVWGSEIPELDP